MTGASFDEPERKLAAILAADVVGFSRMMGQDEVGTLARLDAARRAVIDPVLGAHRGRVFKEMGDGLLVEFGSVVQALRAAVAIQAGLAGRVAEGPRITLRIGVHQGDVLVQGTDLLGDGVNVAARLEGLAPPGGICMSARVREDAVGKVALVVEDGGERSLRNIAQPMRVFLVRAPEPAASTTPILGGAARLLVAVTGFASAGGAAAAALAAELSLAMVESLSRWPGLLAAPAAPAAGSVAQTPSEQARESAQAIGAAFVLQGAVRQEAAGLLAALRVLDVATGQIVWSGRQEVAGSEVPEVAEGLTELVGAVLRPMAEPTLPLPGGPAHRLTMVQSAEPGPPQGHVVVLTPTRLVIGRQFPSDLVLPRGEISRTHCQVDLQGEAVVVTDLGSTNGTFVNDQRITVPTRLGHGAALRIGPYVLRYVGAAEDEAVDPEATMIV